MLRISFTMRRLALLVSVLTPGSLLWAQSASKIIDLYVRAAGGRAALARIHSTKVEGRVAERGSGKAGAYTLITSAPDHLYLETILAGEPTREAYNGKSAWKQDAGGLHTLTGEEAARLETTARFRNTRLLSGHKDKLKLRLAGHALVNGRDAFIVDIASPAGRERRVFIDAESQLLVREQLPGDAGDEEIFYSDYRLWTASWSLSASSPAPRAPHGQFQSITLSTTAGRTSRGLNSQPRREPDAGDRSPFAGPGEESTRHRRTG